jgi:chromate transporter
MKDLKWLSSLMIPKLAWIFLKIGIVFFGGGFVVIPVIHRELVQNLHLLTERQFVDGTAISQLTPGPVAILATFAGYKISGVAGALVATIAMFLPGSVLMVFLSRSYAVLKDMDTVRNAFNTLIPVVVGLLLASTWTIGRTAMTSWYSVLIFLAALILLIWYKINPALLIIAAAISGLLFHIT